MPADPLLTPFTLKHLTFKNRIITTSHTIDITKVRTPKAITLVEGEAKRVLRAKIE